MVCSMGWPTLGESAAREKAVLGQMTPLFLMVSPFLVLRHSFVSLLVVESLCGGLRGCLVPPLRVMFGPRSALVAHVELEVVATFRDAVLESPPLPLRAVACTGCGRSYSMVQCGRAGDPLPPKWVCQHSTPRQTQRSTLTANRCVRGSQHIVLLVHDDL
jgi:hypothetical protein